MYIVIKECPCKIIEVTVSKTGKHGHARCHITAIDIFTGKKLEEHTPSTHNVEEAIVERDDFQLVKIDKDGFLTYLQKDGKFNELLSLESGTELFDRVQELYKVHQGDNNQVVQIQVTSAMG